MEHGKTTDHHSMMQTDGTLSAQRGLRVARRGVAWRPWLNACPGSRP